MCRNDSHCFPFSPIPSPNPHSRSHVIISIHCQLFPFQSDSHEIPLRWEFPYPCTSVIACLHRRHGQGKSVLSCLIGVGGVNSIGNKTRQFCLVSTQFPICNCSVSNILRTTKNLEIGNWVETRVNCLVLSLVVFTPLHTDKTRLLSCPCRRCEQAVS